ncbi:MAG: hypothetical protein LBP23_10645 [Treponema sp.]|jgi:hypothetical protein|nr:hypothetical protein [Treponema sp.]
MKLSARASYIYTPAFGGNRKLPEGARAAFEIIRPKPEEREDLFHLDVERDASLTGADGKPPPSEPMVFRRRYNVGRIFRRHIGKISNVEVEYPEGEAVPITSGKEFAECPLFGVAGLVQELVLEVISDVLTEDEKKTTG